MKVKFDEVISGHGEWLSDRTFTVPEGVTLTIVAPPGAVITDKLGGYIEAYAKTGHMEWPLPLQLRKPAPAPAVPHALFAPPKRERVGLLIENKSGFPRTYHPGEKAPDFRIYPPDGLAIKETRSVSGSHHDSTGYALRSNDVLEHRAILTAHPETLSNMVKANMGNIIVAACSDNPDLPYADYTVDVDPYAAACVSSMPAHRGDTMMMDEEEYTPPTMQLS